MEILSHRYLLEGKDKHKENTLTQLALSLEHCNFFETDIRRFPSGEFYISHDPLAETWPERDAREHVRLWREHPETRVALNIKELGYEKDLLDFLRKERVLVQVFWFDMELLGADISKYIAEARVLEPKLNLAVRVSDKNEPVARALNVTGANIVWLDEFEQFWATEADVRALQKSGKKVYCISPDLHGFSLNQTQKRWSDFIAWGADGICTDYPLLLKRNLSK